MGKVLCVDDSEPMRKLVSLVLAVAGHQVTVACCGTEALQKLREQKFDLLVSDVNMPGMSGLELIAFARQICPEMPILVLTTENQERMNSFGPAHSADGWVQKPFQPRLFGELVSRLIG